MVTDEERRRATLTAANERLKILSTEERASLCEVGKRLGAMIPDEHRDALIKAGLVKEGLGGPALTFLGEGAVLIAGGDSS
jgi:DnaJ-domain-containing protein 1